MAPSELASIREALTSHERTVLASIGTLRADLSAYAATQAEHARRLAEIDARCATSQRERATLATSAAQLADLRAGATHWTRVAIGVLLAALGAVGGALLRGAM